MRTIAIIQTLEVLSNNFLYFEDMPEENLKILVIRFSSIGDIVLTSPVVRILHRQLNAEVHFLVKPEYIPLVKDNPHIHKVWTYEKEKGWKDIAARLRNEDFDFILDLHHNIRSIAISKMVGSRTFRFNKLNIQKWALVNFKLDWMPDLHIVERYAEAAKPLGVKLDGEGLDLYIEQANEIDTKEKFSLEKREFGVFAVGAAHPTKQLPTSQAIPILNELSHRIVLVGGPSDIQLADEIHQNTGEHVINAVGEMNLQQTASLVQQARFVMAPDTGVMHMAAAMKRPLIVFWGNTVERFGMYPYFGDEKVPYKSIEVKDLSCRPCSKIGFDECPKGHFLCMKAWDPIQVAGEIQHFITSAGW